MKTLRIATFLLMGALLFHSLDTAAQSRTRVGLKGGLNASSLFYDSQGVNDKHEWIGFHLSVFAQAPIGEFFALQPELLYMTKGASAKYSVLGFNGALTLSTAIISIKSIMA